jgi:hypothetical protein
MKDCIPDEIIAAYVDGQVNPEERERVESHLVHCDLCIEQLALLKQAVDSSEMFAQLKIPDRILARAEALIAERFGHKASILDVVVRLAEGLVSVVKTTGEVLSPDLAPVPVRGRRDRGRNIFVRTRAGSADVIVEVDSRGADPVLRVLLREAETEALLDGVRVDLAGPEGPESRFAQQGLVDFGPRRPGKYRMEIEDAGGVNLEISTSA